MPHRARESRHRLERRGAEIRCAVRHGVLHEHHPGSPHRDRGLDRRADHCGNPRGPTTERRAYHPDPSVHDVQRDGRRGSPRAGRVPQEPAAHHPNESAEEDQRAPLRKRVPAGLAGRVRFEETPPTQAPTGGMPRGEYLVRVVGHCGECHTPRGITQATDNSRFLAGNPKGPENSVVPNITPDKDTGLTWSEEEIAEYLGTGNTPSGDVAGGLMGEVIQGTSAGHKDLTKADRLAIARYLKTVPAIKNKIGK